jgi:glucose-6-phosphate 1-dehydrogenase
MPALYNLAGSRLLDDGCRSSARTTTCAPPKRGGRSYRAPSRASRRDANAEFHPDHIDAATWDWVAKRLDYIVFDFEHAGDYAQAQGTLGEEPRRRAT